ncbi:cystathionine gamma-synthase [Bacillus oleivorans]|uniref:homocysteine desulfhydrase n=1 Tax=Bacillus oleivorans TaxID=1448271 RepID=A0A285CZ56_9BACI|nr:PLP-dependent aspartate aminotransferase family protein [Bacillus oleivorans]SNX72809.1 cystathionine gamma-synthase [Bacillus oleivorans]
MSQSFETKAVHFAIDQASINRSKTTPIYQTSVFSFKTLEELESHYTGELPYLYTRNGNPNTDELGQAVALLENAEAGVASSSGLSAIMAGILAVCKNGDHIIASEDVYGGTYHFLEQQLKEIGIKVTFVDFTYPEQIEAAITPNTKLLYSETITNPFLCVESLETLVTLAKKHNLTSMVDNTFATPYLLRPLEKGIDIVIHSATKYIGGHSDVTAGVVVGSKKWVELAKQKVVTWGANVSPFEAWLACRGLKTMALRMRQQCENAEKLAAFLQEHPAVEKVFYPTSVSEKGNGAMVSVELKPEIDMSLFFANLSWIAIVPSLAGVETTVSYPLATSHRALPKEVRKKLGITSHLVRISVGIEDFSDIENAFQQALKLAEK